MSPQYYGKLLIMGKDGGADLEYPLDKTSILIGRQAAEPDPSSRPSLRCFVWLTPFALEVQGSWLRHPSGEQGNQQASRERATSSPMSYPVSYLCQR